MPVKSSEETGGLRKVLLVVAIIVLAPILLVGLFPRPAPAPPPPKTPCARALDGADFLTLQWDRPYPAYLAAARDRNGDGVLSAQDDLAFWWWLHNGFTGHREVTGAVVDDGRTAENEATPLLALTLEGLRNGGSLTDAQLLCAHHWLEVIGQ